MLKVCLGMLLAVCAAGWFFNKMSVRILLYFMKSKDYTLPTDAELKACSRKAVAELFTFGNKN